jgi:hypothetical protein
VKEFSGIFWVELVSLDTSAALAVKARTYAHHLHADVLELEDQRREQTGLSGS